HVAEPVELALQTELRDPADLPRDVGEHVAQAVHADVPLVYETEYQLGTAAPAVRVTMLVLVRAKQDALFAQIVRDGPRNFADMHAGEPVESVDVDAVFVERSNRG